MIKLENTVLASPEQMMFIIQGMRNPMNSWDKSDSKKEDGYYILRELDNPTHYRVLEDDEVQEELEYWERQGVDCIEYVVDDSDYILGPNDKSLMQRLSKAGTDHRKFMRMMPVYVRITAPLYWWKEFDTYKVGTVANSCSTMHKIQAEEFKWGDFSNAHLTHTDSRHMDENEDAMNALQVVINSLNYNRNKYLETKDKKYWWQMIQLLPSSYNQTRNVMLNYEVLYNMYHARKNHKLDEWREFCKWIETLEFSFLITGEDVLKEGLQEGLQPGA